MVGPERSGNGAPSLVPPLEPIPIRTLVPFPVLRDQVNGVEGVVDAAGRAVEVGQRSLLAHRLPQRPVVRVPRFGAAPLVPHQAVRPDPVLVRGLATRRGVGGADRHLWPGSHNASVGS